MQIKNKILLSILFIFTFFANSVVLYAEEFNISAKEISIDKLNNTVIGTGSVEVKDKKGNTIRSDKVIYEKSKQFLSAEGYVEVITEEGYVFKTY